MSDPTETIETEESPDFLPAPKKGNGIRKPNKVPQLIAVGAIAFVLLVVGYNIYDRAEAAAKIGAVGTDEEEVFVSRVAEPPVKRPEGPDVYAPPAMPAPVYSPESGEMVNVAMAEPESVRRAREKKAAQLEAAMNAAPGVEKSGEQSDMPRTNGTIPPPPPQQYRENEEAAGGENLNEKKFLAGFNPDDSPYLKHTRMPAVSPYEIKAGAVIPGVMISGVNSGLPGQIVGQVRQDVYDSATGRFLLIPAGARLVGTYDSSISPGQERIFVAWQRIVYPDSSSISLDSMPGADQSGLAGFHDQVDNHYARTFGQAFMLSLFSAGIQLSQPRGAVSGTYNAQQIGAAAIGQQLGQLGMQIARRNLNMQPTLEIRPGFLFTIAVNKDMVLPGPWQGDSVVAAR